jgi:predicted Rossmann fold nucleotide-binding protein DprA/Smf involved in DNA uptake
MAGRDTTLASLLLVNRLVAVTDAAPLVASEYWPLIQRVHDPGALLGTNVRDVAERIGDDVLAPRIVRLLDAGTALSLKLDALTEQGVTPITPFDEGYPDRLRERLGHAAPPVLFCAGDAALLASPSIGVVGSREVGSEAAEVTEGMGRAIADAGHVLTTGGSKGVDLLAMQASLEVGGRVVGILADPLDQRLRPPETRRRILKGSLALCTPYAPAAPYTVARAQARNKIVYARNDHTIVVTVEEGADSTWSGATEALEHDYGTVVVWTGAGAGVSNTALVERGAEPVSSVADATATLHASERSSPAPEIRTRSKERG